MNPFKTAIVGVAAAGLMAAQPALAQQGDEFEEGIGAPEGSGPVMFLFLMAALVVGLALIFEDGSDGGVPVSP